MTPRKSLAPCVGCEKNMSKIKLLMLLGHDFRNAVKLLERLLVR